MAWDPDRYCQEVMDPARRANNVPPADLYLRYGLPAGVSDPAEFAAQVGRVCAYWREKERTRGYRKLAQALLREHAQLEQDGPLTLRKFRQLHQQARQEQQDQLDRLARAEAGAATHAGPATVTRLQNAVSFRFTHAEVADSLRRAGVRVVEAFPELPTAPHLKQGALASHVRELGKQLSAEVVFGAATGRDFRVLGGFRLTDGTRLDEAALSTARDRAAALPYSDRTAATENVLSILTAAARQPGQLDALLLSEVVEQLRDVAAAGFAQPAIAERAHDLGLEVDEAGLIASALLAGDTVAALRQQAEVELTAGRLRGAQRLAAGLPADDPLRDRIMVVDTTVTELGRAADEELARERPEQAALRLAEALRKACDDAGLAERLAAVPPPAPRNPGARLAGDHVMVTWEPSPALAGPVRYRVSRGTGRAPASPADGTAVIAGTTEHTVLDTAAPTGAELRYSVFADRGGEACSPPATTPPLVLAPDVTDLSLTTAETSLAVSWPAPRGAQTILVRRTTGHPPRVPEDGTPVESSVTGFTDTGLRTGTEYFYRISVSYRTGDGQRRQSAGIVVSAVPEPEPGAVTDLELTVPADGVAVVVACWTPPRYGRVSLMRSQVPPPWPAGCRITPQDAAALHEVPGVPRRRSDGRDYLELSSLPPGRHYLLPVTSRGSALVAGSTAEAGLAGPVTGLTARRVHDSVLLAWEWPEGATDTVISWSGQEERRSWRVYHEGGGVELTVGPAETQVEVRAVYPHSGGQLNAAPARVTVPGRAVAVRYRIRTRWWRRRQRTVEFSAEQAAQLPALLIVQATGPYPPDRPAGSETLVRVEPQPIGPGQRLAVSVPVRRGPGWLACFTDPAATDPAPILLFHPAAAEMRIR